jgi:simple sugar transport system permease protein
VAGNGQRELIEVLTGLRQPVSGLVSVCGRDLTGASARKFFEAGVAHIPEERSRRGIVPGMSVAENLVLRRYRAQFWNIGAEGQLLARAVGAAGVALFSPIPAPWLLPGMFATGFVAGSLWGCLPALLKLKLGVNEVITTLMLNYIALYLVQWLIYGPWKGKSMRGFAYTDPFPQGARLPLIPGTRVHWPTLVLGVVLAVGIAFLLSRTRLGYEVRVIGQNPEAARYAGIDAARVTLLVMLISGGAAGLAGVGEVAGMLGRG